MGCPSDNSLRCGGRQQGQEDRSMRRAGVPGEERFYSLLGRSRGTCSQPGDVMFGEIRRKGSENIPDREWHLFSLGSASVDRAK